MDGQRRSGYPKRRAEEPLSDALGRPRATGGGFSLRPAGEQASGGLQGGADGPPVQGKGSPVPHFWGPKSPPVSGPPRLQSDCVNRA